MNKAPNYSEFSITRLFDRLCGLVAIEATADKSYWIGALSAARLNFEAAISTLYELAEAQIVVGIRPIVDVLIGKIYAELEQ